MRMTQNRPVLPEVVTQEQHDMTHRDSGPRPLTIAVGSVAECDHANRVTARRRSMSPGQQLSRKNRGVLLRTAAEAGERNFEDDRVPHRSVQARGTLLDLSHNHVRPISRTAKSRIGGERSTSERAVPTPPDHVVTGSGEPKRQNVEIRDRPRVVAAERLQHWILGNREVPVDVKVRLHEGDRGIHCRLHYDARGAAAC